MSKVITWPGMGDSRTPVVSLLDAANAALGGLWRPPAVGSKVVYGHDTRSEMRHRVRELEAIFAISTALRAACDDNEMVPILLDKTLEVLQAEHGAVILQQETPPGYSIRLGRGDLKTEEGRFLPPDVELNGRKLDVTKAYVTDRLSDDMRRSGMNGHGRLGPGILVPLRSATDLLGFLVIGRRRADSFDQADVDILTAISEMAGNALHRIQLHKELEDSFLGTVLALANAVDAKDTYTGGHSARLAEMAMKVGRHLGITNGFFEDLRWGAMLHDIGKIGVPDSILRKPAPLTADEWDTIRQHPVVGAQILAPVAKLAGAARIVRHHHEWWDGKGYPDGLKGEDIPLGGRILAVVDAYSAITDERAYKPSRSHEEAMAELARCSGSQFDPAIVQAFVAVMS